MKFTKLALNDAYIIEINQLTDERGFFERIFCEEEFHQIRFSKKIVQINHSFTKQKGAVRGLHFQFPPYTETKIVKCLKGKVIDIIVDLRKNSTTFLKWTSVELSEQNNKMIFIPDGFAHGFQTLEKNTEMLYFHTEFYSKENESGINIFDPKLNIKLPLKVTEISSRDEKHAFLDTNFKGISL